jgi:hypothetical protein
MKKSISLVLAWSLLLAFIGAPSVFAKSKAEKEAAQAIKVKAGIAKLGVGEEARVTVKLRDKTKLSGYVSRIGEDSFAVTDLKTGATTEVLYPSVTQVKGQNVASGAKIAIWVGVAVGVTLLVIWITLMAVTGIKALDGVRERTTAPTLSPFILPSQHRA